MRAAHTVLAFVLLSAVGPSAARGAIPALHAHRGGSISFGRPDQYEDTLEAFQRRIAQTPGVWLEMDAGVSSDGVPFVIHDSTLDRTTDCHGALLDHTAAEIDACKVDVLGVQSANPATVAPKPAGSPDVHVPRLAAVLALAKRTGAPVNLEIKRIPGDPHYTPGDTSFATHVMDVVRAAHLDPDKLIMQSFDPTNLDVAKQELPGVTTSFLTEAPDPASVAVCAQRGYDYLSPGGVPDAATMAAARRLGVKVVPYTLDTTADIQAAAAAGVDAIITNDIPLARQALGLGATADVPPATLPAPATPSATRTLRLQIVSRRRRGVLRHGVLQARVTGPAGATVVLAATTAGGRLLARARVRVTRSSGQTAALRLSATGRRLLAHSRRPLRVVLHATSGRASTRASVRLR